MGLQKRALARAGVALLFLLTMANGPGLQGAAPVTYTAVASGDWDNPATWGGVVPSAGVDISIPSGVAVILPPDLDVVIDHATLTIGGTLFVGGTLTLDRGGVGQILTGGELWFILGTLELNSGSVGVMADQARLTNAGKLVNSGGRIDVGVWTELVNSGTIYNDGEFLVSIRAEVHNQGMFENVGHVETRLISGSVAGVVTSWFFNEGTFHNSDALAVVTVGGTFSNSNHVINHGTMVASSDSGYHGTLANGGTGASRIDNYGVINVEVGLVNNSHSGDLIHNHAGAQILVSGRVHNLTGTLRNDTGATVTLASTASLENRAVIDNDGQITNGGSVSNIGVFRQRCNGLVSGNPVTGNALQDWCDVVAPTLNLPSSLVVEAAQAAGTVVTYSVSATDDKDPLPGIVCAPQSGALFPLGTTAVSCTATDRVGNSRGGSFSVTVGDTTAPVLSVLGDPYVTVVVNNTYVEDGAVADDLVDGDLTSAIQLSGTVDIHTVGTYTLTFEVVDAAGNLTSVSRVVTVISGMQAMEMLSTDITAMALAPADDADLQRPLTRMQALLADRTSANDLAACRLVPVFRGAVDRKQRSGALTTTQAARLQDRATAISLAIGCSGG